jgi:hypothetical protein
MSPIFAQVVLSLSTTGNPGLLVLPGPLVVPPDLEVQISGTWPLRLVVLGDFYIAGTIRADGPPGAAHSSGLTAGGGAGGPGGAPGQTGFRGLGHWPGCGGAPGLGGGGAGFGTAGGTGGNYWGFCAQGPDGGLTGGDALLSQTRGGAGGGGGGGGQSIPAGWGGGGGGGLYLVCTGTLTVTGTVSARGGDGEAAGADAGGGGGGSGGAILLRGLADVSVDPGATIDVGGGDGGAGGTPGGAGGEGRIRIEGGPAARILVPGQMALGARASASSYWVEGNGTAHLPAKAFNGVFEWSDGWNPGAFPPNTLTADLAGWSNRWIGRASVTLDYAVGALILPLTLTLEGSDDGLGWSTLGATTGLYGLWQTQVYEFIPSIPAPHFLRLTLSGAPPGVWVAVNEVELQEGVP